MHRRNLLTLIIGALVTIGLITPGFAQTVPSAPVANNIQNTSATVAEKTESTDQKKTKKRIHKKGYIKGEHKHKNKKANGKKGQHKKKKSTDHKGTDQAAEKTLEKADSDSTPTVNN